MVGLFLPDVERRAEKNSLSRMKRNLTKRDRLKHTADIGRVFSSKTRVSCLGAKLVYRKNDIGRNRFTVTLIRKYGNAIERNRAKRTAREAYRLCRSGLYEGYDMIMILYRSEDTLQNRSKQLAELLQRASLVKE